MVAHIRREVFFFSDGHSQLYGSLYAATSPNGPGVVISPSIGVEFIPALNLGHAVARGVARAGGAGIVIHPPGHGDSHGEPDDLTLDWFATSVEAATSEAVERVPGVDWGLAGVRMGAPAAALAASSSSPAFLLLIEPVIDVTTHLSRLERSSLRATLGNGEATSGWAFGYPLPRDRWVGGRDHAIRAIRSFGGGTFCVAYAQGQTEAEALGVRTERISGIWTLNRKQRHEDLAELCIRQMSGTVMNHAG